jgi:hypothetical protein
MGATRSERRDDQQDAPMPTRTPGVPGEVPGVDTGRDETKRLDDAPVKPLTDPKDTKGG